MIRSARATSISLLFFGAVVLAQDERPAADATITVPAGEAPVMDGRVGPDEWKNAARFDLRSGAGVPVKGWMRRVGRELYIAIVSDEPPAALGLRLNFTDPVSRRVIPVMVTPINPPRAPLAVFRETTGSDAEPVSCARCDVRFDFSKADRFTLELRLPMALLEFTRSDKTYGFTAELWNLEIRRTVAVFPVSAASATGAAPARLKPADTWGADVPSAGDASPVQPALKLLEEVGPGTEGMGKVIAATGWSDGRRTDAPLAQLQERLMKALATYPDYVSLHAQLVQVRSARNDIEGALAALDALGTAFPAMATTSRHVVIRSEFLRDLGRFGDAVRYLDDHPDHLKDDPRVARQRDVIAGMRDAWKLEEEIRRAEEKRDDLPRVKLKTTKGDIVIELFEDDAPNGVANFVSLVERGFYRGTRFFWSEGGRRTIGGDPNTRDEDPHNDGYGDPGYLIESAPGRRLNFSYVVAYADKRRVRRTEGSTFVIHIAPFPGIDGLNTVFGRVIEGKDTVRKLEYYDTIEDAVVLRKRDHEYVPVKR